LAFLSFEPKGFAAAVWTEVNLGVRTLGLRGERLGVRGEKSSSWSNRLKPETREDAELGLRTINLAVLESERALSRSG